MIQTVSKKLADALIRVGGDENQRAVYAYGIECTILLLLAIGGIVVSAILNCTKNSRSVKI